MSALLDIRDLTAHYGDFQALFGIDLTLNEGETLAIIGANGAGKTTLMRAITGIARVTAGTAALNGKRIDRLTAPDILRAGISMVPEGRRLFPSLTVEENLLIGAHVRKGNAFWNLSRIFELFPVLAERRGQPATALSGGQQQMVAIGRALMSNPSVLLCDELSLGLAPVVIREIYAAFPTIRESGTAIIVVEQDIGQALKIADGVHCMMEGRITLSGPPCELSRDAIHDAYFGISHA
ncbi:ABC transporter ATP-binding protein (plasmid) [Martelella lutilitoris]|uniref:ABC transporter ATP-binding protein n=1 Tax=Martelella lutilitoris TaxID=2583532 RepID=A0A7T7HPU5_9HYPH|nr:ABC transporter ATP-binding protein [Martelella lutilitoris]QQM32997.1 ABC transporter ATP-binding protein [Martelella lutilitoris]QRX65339.1 ABC transporter ATP-binding protein [Dysgonomonadaceae bacterium zrk40]